MTSRRALIIRVPNIYTFTHEPANINTNINTNEEVFRPREYHEEELSPVGGVREYPSASSSSSRGILKDTMIGMTDERFHFELPVEFSAGDKAVEVPGGEHCVNERTQE